MYASKIIYTDKDGKKYELYYPIILNPVYDEAFEFTEITSGDYKGTYSVKSKGGLKGDIVVPSFYRDSEVTTIGDYAFLEFNSKITNVEIPSSIKVIGDSAFNNCTRLVGIKIPDGVASIGEWAFHKCESITSVVIGGDTPRDSANIVIPKTVKSLGDYAFSGCSGLVTANLSDSTILVEVEVLLTNGGTSVSFYNGVGKGWFDGCIRLENVSLPENSSVIGEEAFFHCISLTIIDIPNYVFQISDQAFSMCHNLENLNMPTNLRVIGELAFRNCYRLTDIEIPQMVRSIGWEAFFGCRNLTVSVSKNNQYFSIVDGCLVEKSTNRVIFANKNANVPSGTSAIDGGAFSGKTFGAPVKIPLSVTEIHSLAFQECENLVLHVEAESKPADWADDWCDDSVTVVWGYKEECEHSYGGWVTTVLPTCTKFGTMEHTCSICGEVETALIEPLGHNWVDATCTTPKTCSRCGETIGEPLGHDWGEWTSNDDRTHSRTCRNESTHIETELCSYSKVVTPPTCTEQGYTTYTCSVCGHIYESDYTAKLEHNYKETIKPPTCTEDGYTTYTCTVCGNSYVADHVFALGHISSDWIIDARPTGLTAGSKHKECTRCGEILETATIPKLENADEYLTYTLLDSGEEYSVKATYLDYLPSELTIPSTFNGKSVSVVEFEAFAGHRESPDIRVALTKVILPDSIKAILPGAFDGCTRLTEINIPMGVEYIGEDAFDDCNNLTIYCEAYEKPDAWDDNWNSSNCNVVWAYRCTNGHTWGFWEDIKPATCTTDGEERHTCKVCGYTETRVVKAFGHNYSTREFEATCTEQGYTEYTCDECLDTYKASYVPALGHDWGELVTTQYPTCESEGMYEETCKRCGEKKTTPITALGHVWIAPTCTEPQTCGRCGATEGNALGHVPSDWIIDVQPTVQAEGSKHKECTRCGVVLETASIPKLEDPNTYLVTENGEFLTDEQGNLLII